MASIRGIISKIYSDWRSFGTIAAIEAVSDAVRCRVLGSRKHILYFLDPVKFFAPDCQSHDVELILSTPEMLSGYIADSSLELSQEFIEEHRSSRLIAALNKADGALMAYGLFSDQPVAISGKVYFCPPEGTLYLFKFFVVPEFRRRQIVRLLVSKIVQAERKGLFAIIISNNFISQAAFSAMGFRRRFAFIVRPQQSVRYYLKDLHSRRFAA